MKNNTENVKDLLRRAASAMPPDFALSEARTHLRLAIQKLEQVEKKRQNRAIAEKEQTIAQWPYITPQGNGMETLKYIDNMIAEEKKKLDEIAERKRKQTQDEDGDDLQTVLG